MAVGQDPFVWQVYLNRLTASPITPKGFVILHVSYIDKQITGFLRRQCCLRQFEAEFRAARIAARIADPDSFLDKSLNLKTNL